MGSAAAASREKFNSHGVASWDSEQRVEHFRLVVQKWTPGARAMWRNGSRDSGLQGRELIPK